MHVPSDVTVDLGQMLQRRDARVAIRQALLARHAGVIVQLTLVNPGPVKDTAQALFVFEQGLHAVSKALAVDGHRILASESAYLSTGLEAMWVVASTVPAIKTIAISLETQHPLGRLWDIDVIDQKNSTNSRQDLGHPLRRCMLCEQPAHACSRSQRHTLPELQTAMKDIIDAFRNCTAG